MKLPKINTPYKNSSSKTKSILLTTLGFLIGITLSSIYPINYNLPILPITQLVDDLQNVTPIVTQIDYTYHWITFNPAYGIITQAIQTSKIYDKDNTNYYIDPSNSATSIKVAGDIKVGSVTIKGDGSVSTGLNADKIDGYEASDLLAAAGSNNGEYRIYYACAVAKSCYYCPPWPSVSVPNCPPGWEEIYYRDGLNDPGYTYYPGFHLISDGDITCQGYVSYGSYYPASCCAKIKDGSGTIIYKKCASINCGINVKCVRINCGYRVCKKIS